MFDSCSHCTITDGTERSLLSDKLLAAWLADIERGVAVDRSRQTVADTLRYWLDTYVRPNLRPRTVATYAEVIDHHLIPGLGGIRLQSLTASQVQAFYSKLLANGVGLCTIAT